MQDVAAFLHGTARELSLSSLRKEMIFIAGLFNVLVLMSEYRFLFVYFFIATFEILEDRCASSEFI